MTRALTRWEPFAELGELRARLDGMFGMADDRMPAIDLIRLSSPGRRPAHRGRVTR